jgi:hypothetical protein
LRGIEDKRNKKKKTKQDMNARTDRREVVRRTDINEGVEGDRG